MGSQVQTEVIKVGILRVLASSIEVVYYLSSSIEIFQHLNN